MPYELCCCGSSLNVLITTLFQRLLCCTSDSLLDPRVLLLRPPVFRPRRSSNAYASFGCMHRGVATSLSLCQPRAQCLHGSFHLLELFHIFCSRHGPQILAETPRQTVDHLSRSEQRVENWTEVLPHEGFRASLRWIYEDESSPSR